MGKPHTDQLKLGSFYYPGSLKMQRQLVDTRLLSYGLICVAENLFLSSITCSKSEYVPQYSQASFS